MPRSTAFPRTCCCRTPCHGRRRSERSRSGSQWSHSTAFLHSRRSCLHVHRSCLRSRRSCLRSDSLQNETCHKGLSCLRGDSLQNETCHKGLWRVSLDVSICSTRWRMLSLQKDRHDVPSTYENDMFYAHHRMGRFSG